ncbi:MAG: cation diffusion facilitator family transporter [Verrucomicrobiota bacterium]|nr:cation diffusion facilitator family transporter [Verrucomicrobiota bacterium]
MSAHPTSANSASNLQSGARWALFGILINLALAIIKITAGVLGNAYALIADGIESALDIGGSAIIWGGLKFAARPPDETHPYGHGKAEPLAAGIVAVGVIGAAIGLALESWREIRTPHHAPAPFTLIVLIVVVVVKELLFRNVSRLGEEVDSTAVKTDAWHHRADAITSVAAFIGISIALIGGRGWESADDWAALFACAVIATNGVLLFAPALREILDTAPRGDICGGIRRTASSTPGVVEVEKCLVRKMGLNFYVDLHLRVDGDISVRHGHDIAHDVKEAIRETNPRVADVLVHVEPAELAATAEAHAAEDRARASAAVAPR